MVHQQLKGQLEALLFASGQPLPIEQLATLLAVAVEYMQELVQELTADLLAAEERGLTIIAVAGGYQLATKPELATVVARLGLITESKLSPAAMETLAIIAFKQPVTRAEIEAIRGVSADSGVTTLLERGFIREFGRKAVIGRPILYGTTEQFLQCFGLHTLQDLPDLPALISATAKRDDENS